MTKTNLMHMNNSHYTQNKIHSLLLPQPLITNQFKTSKSKIYYFKINRMKIIKINNFNLIINLILMKMSLITR